MAKQGVVIIGDGGHALSVAEVIQSTNNFYVEGYVSKLESNSERMSNFKHLGSDNDLPNLVKKCNVAVLGIGISQSLNFRMKAFQSLVEIGFTLPAFIAKDSYVAKSAFLGSGTVVFNGVVINANVAIGLNCVINSMSLIEHETAISDGSFVSTGVIVNGNTRIGKCTLIGSGSVIRENLSIGDNCTIGMGSLVLKDLGSEQTHIRKANSR